MDSIIHFQILTDEPQKAISFYKNVFGWKVEKQPGEKDSWIVLTNPKGAFSFKGILRLRSKKEKPLKNVYTLEVDFANEILTKILQNGGEVITPKKDLPGSGWLAYCKDSEGNTFGIVGPASYSYF